MTTVVTTFLSLNVPDRIDYEKVAQNLHSSSSKHYNDDSSTPKVSYTHNMRHGGSLKIPLSLADQVKVIGVWYFLFFLM